MNTSDKKIIKRLLIDGYLVVINKLDGKTFTERFSVYQGFSRGELKHVCINNDGKISGLQG